MAKVECRLNSYAFISTQECADFRLRNLAVGKAHKVDFRVTDRRGNVQSTSYSWYISAATATTISLTGLPSNPTTSNSANISYVINDSGLGVFKVECRLNIYSFIDTEECKDFRLRNLEAGRTHTVDFRVTDLSGNVRTASYTWKIEAATQAQPTTITLTGLPSNPTTATTANISYTLNDTGMGVAKVECRLDSYNFISTDECADFRLSNLEAGRTHTVDFRVTDLNGNVKTASYTWMISAPSNPTTPTPTPRPPPTTGSTVYMKSGFEGGVRLSAPYSCGTACYQDFQGVDSVTGYDWSKTLFGSKYLMQLLANTSVTSSSVESHIKNEFVTTTGPDGKTTRAFQSTLLKRNGVTQDPMQILPKTDPGPMYISYDMKLPSDALQKLGNWGYRVVFEWKANQDDPGNVSRLILHIYTDANGKPYWNLKADDNTIGNRPTTNIWELSNKTVPVPFGRWFKLEIFWDRGTYSKANGRAYVAVDGQVVFDH